MIVDHKKPNKEESNLLIRVGEALISGSFICLLTSAAALLVSGRLEGEAKAKIMASGAPPDIFWLMLITMIGVVCGKKLLSKGWKQSAERFKFIKMSRKNGQARLR
jgi:hypothetical protein